MIDLADKYIKQVNAAVEALRESFAAALEGFATATVEFNATMAQIDIERTVEMERRMRAFEGGGEPEVAFRLPMPRVHQLGEASPDV